MIGTILAYVFLLWYAIMLTAAFCGFRCIYTRFAHPAPAPSSLSHGDHLLSKIRGENPDFEHLEPVSIVRPVKGLDPELASCLESSFLQNYPLEKLEVIFCVAEATDAAIPVLKGLLAKYPKVDAHILVSPAEGDYFGPNPKVNNLAKGFKRAKYDLVWIMDSNVWASRNLLANSVAAMMHNTNCGAYLGNTARRVRLVHHVPLALALDNRSGPGSSLDEMFLFTSHSKFYVSLNNLAIAPCVNGKSNLYRKSDLDHAVARIPLQRSPFFSDANVILDARRVAEKGPGHSMEFFAKYIGEDNMIGIALWEYCGGRTALTGDVVVQPLQTQNQADSLREYCNRRVRWLRVRKYMVLAATLVEPTTESIICGLMGTYAVSVLILGRLFSARFFVFHMACWLVCDYVQYHVWARHINSVTQGPSWLHAIGPSRSLHSWVKTWCLRELLALPIWVAAMVGHEIEWRGKPFRIKKDLSVEEL